jgi:cytoskeletal protein CcmA (bactofilin family)
MLGVNESSQQRTSIVLGPRDHLEGRLYVEGDLTVSGTVVGSLEATGDVEIATGGSVRGPVTTRNKLVVAPHASLEGDVQVGRLVVQDGAVFSGNVAMVKPGQTLKRTNIDAQVAAAVAETKTVAAGVADAGTATNGSKVSEVAKPPEPTTAKPANPNPGKSPDTKGKRR